jgi:hypothetical protein
MRWIGLGAPAVQERAEVGEHEGLHAGKVSGAARNSARGSGPSQVPNPPHAYGVGGTTAVGA